MSTKFTLVTKKFFPWTLKLELLDKGYLDPNTNVRRGVEEDNSRQSGVSWTDLSPYLSKVDGSGALLTRSTVRVDERNILHDVNVDFV